jgi:hypothetical protein
MELIISEYMAKIEKYLREAERRETLWDSEPSAPWRPHASMASQPHDRARHGYQTGNPQRCSAEPCNSANQSHNCKVEAMGGTLLAVSDVAVLNSGFHY